MSKERKHDAEFIKEFTSKISDNKELLKAFKSIVGGSKEDGLFLKAKDRKQVDENIDLLIENVELLKNIAKGYNIENSLLFKTIENESNIIKKTCKELGLTYGQLAEQIGYSEPAIKKAIANDNVSEPMQKAISLYLRNLELEKQLEDYETFKTLIKKAII